ncbi:MFS transporter [Providencia sp. SP181]|uniref:MFS transporter n=1 Tax=Providencia sp. SP181 TaxID=3136277 RepID=UPI003D299A26
MRHERIALSESKRTNWAIWILALAAFVIVTTEFVVIGMVPTLSRDLNISVPMAGQLVTVFSVMVAVVGPVMATWLSRYERRKLFTWILVLFAIGNAASAMAPGYWSLMFVRLLPAALVSVFWGVGSEAAGQISPRGQEGKAVAHVYFGVTAALLLGLPLGTVLGDAVGWRGAFWVLAVMSLVMAVAIHKVLPTIPADSQRSLKSDIAILKNRFFLANLALSLGIFTAIFTAYTYLADLLERSAGVAPSHVGWWLMGFGAVGLIGNYVAGRMVDKHGLAATVIFCFVLAIGAASAAIFAQQTAIFVVCLVAWGIAHTALFPLSQVRVMNSTETGKAVAGTLNISAANGGIASGAIVGGWAISMGSIAIACIAAAALAILCGLLSLIIERCRYPRGTY